MIIAVQLTLIQVLEVSYLGDQTLLLDSVIGRSRAGWAGSSVDATAGWNNFQKNPPFVITLV